MHVRIMTITPEQRAALFRISATRVYVPKDDAAACLALAEQGYIRPVVEGKLHGYCMDLPGTVFVRDAMGYQQR